MSVTLCGVQVENLRGFRSAVLNLDRDIVLLVGPNNSGKTSLLRLLDWVVNTADDTILTGQRMLDSDECALLIPARDTRGGARRLTLLVGIADGRRHQRFNATNGVTRLRFRLRNQRMYINVSTPSRSEPLGHEAPALELLHELRRSLRFKLIPAFRDARSSRFHETLTQALEAKLRERAVHQAQGGAPNEYRQVSRALTTIKEVADGLVEPLWTEMQDGVMGLARDGNLHLDAEAGDLVQWMASNIKFQLVTGDHDSRAVSPVEVGSGLQSLLDLAVLRGEGAIDAERSILAVEEPEAFLHPSAQRTLARGLLDNAGLTRVISTHSSVLVEEAQYGDVVLLRDHKIFPARPPEDDRRRQINTTLTAGQGAEAMFARSVLLVEGPGDRAFFEALRRRIARRDQSHRTDDMAIVQVGSNTAFAPWIRLLESYQDTATGERPIEWLVVADSIDATTEVARAFRDAALTIPAEIDTALRGITQPASAGDHGACIDRTREFNDLAAGSGVRITFLPIDLEWCALQASSQNTLNSLADSFGLARGTRTEFLARLGSKHGAGPGADPRKDPWIRAAIARTAPWLRFRPTLSSRCGVGCSAPALQRTRRLSSCGALRR